MQQQPIDPEQRFLQIENRLAELERKASLQEDRDIALLRRVDDFIADLRRVERVQMRSFEALQTGQQELRASQAEQENRLERIERSLEKLVDVAKDHKQAIETVYQLLSGQQKTND